MTHKIENEDIISASDQLACEFFNRGLYQASIDQNILTLNLLGFRNPLVLKNMANAYYQLSKIDKSLELFREYMSITNSRETGDIRQLAQYLTRTNNFDEARSWIFEKQLDYNEKHLDMGWFLHREGQFKEAFIETEIGRNGAFWSGTRVPPPCTRWEGQPIAGRKLCVIGEAGLGDEIIFCRWIKDLKSMGAIVYYFTNNTLREVITRNFTVFPYDSNVKYDYWVPAMSLPYLIGAESAGNDAYLTPHPVYIAKWKQILAPYKDIIVLNWTGDQNHMENKFREIPVDYLVEKAKGQGTLVSVCMEAKSCPPDVIDLTKEIKSWDDTLAILSLSKRCLTMSSSVSVAAGALGIETHLYDIVVGYFTWCHADNGGLSEWFPNVRVWRQEVQGEWLPVIDKSIDYILNHSG